MISILPFNLPPIVQTTIRLLLSPFHDICLLPEVSIACQARSIVRSTQPDIIVIRGGGEIVNFAEDLERVRQNFRCDRVILLVSDGEPLSTDCFIDHSLCGALHVDELEASLLPILRAVAAGAMPFSKRVIEQNLQQWRQQSSTRLNTENLTTREREILNLMLQGMDNQQIGTALHLGEQTVRNYVSKIYDKLHIGDSEKLALRMRMRLK